MFAATFDNHAVTMTALNFDMDVSKVKILTGIWCSVFQLRYLASSEKIRLCSAKPSSAHRISQKRMSGVEIADAPRLRVYCIPYRHGHYLNIESRNVYPQAVRTRAVC